MPAAPASACDRVGVRRRGYLGSGPGLSTAFMRISLDWILRKYLN
jgi:hypothetical protein